LVCPSALPEIFNDLKKMRCGRVLVPVSRPVREYPTLQYVNVHLHFFFGINFREKDSEIAAVPFFSSKKESLVFEFVCPHDLN